MGSRKEEERNVKIIRGLMKLPPNRRCINCNSLGPQYVCNNFWTFVCMTCSGIHREFTHRVKSVSMSKFTSEEVEALQNGGNQRAREIYLKEWDQQRQRLPDNSNVEKVREFIKVVYVDKRYAGGKNSDKPPRDLQRLRSHEDETRRASSYHSFSQSPPYDFQYEERRFGKQGAMLTRKPGSDRGLYLGKMSSFICSPTRLSDRVAEDRFANEGSVSSFADYSISSGGDLVRSGTDSPSFQKETGMGSPPIQLSRNSSGSSGVHQSTDLFSESNIKRDLAGITRPQRTASLGSSGSLGCSSMPLSNSLGSLLDVGSESEQAAAAHPVKNTTAPQLSAGYGGLDLFEAPVIQESSSAASAVDLFQLSSATSAPIDLFKASPLNPTPSFDLFQPSQALHSSVDLFSIAKNQVTTMNIAPTKSTIPKNEGWATFDNVQLAPSMPKTQCLPQSTSVGSVTFDKPKYDTAMQWPKYQNSIPQISCAATNAWDDDFRNVPALRNMNCDTWNAFGSSVTNLPVNGAEQSSEQQFTAYNPPSTADYHANVIVSEDFNKDGNETTTSYGEHAGHSGTSDTIFGPSLTPPFDSPKAEMLPHAIDRRSTNPFDIPFDPELEHGSFFDMTSLQTALPNVPSPSSFLAAASPSWFPPDPLTTFIPAPPQGGLAYVTGQATSTPLANVQAEGPVVSIGGNPFA